MRAKQFGVLAIGLGALTAGQVGRISPAAADRSVGQAAMDTATDAEVSAFLRLNGLDVSAAQVATWRNISADELASTLARYGIGELAGKLGSATTLEDLLEIVPSILDAGASVNPGTVWSTDGVDITAVVEHLESRYHLTRTGAIARAEFELPPTRRSNGN